MTQTLSSATKCNSVRAVIKDTIFRYRQPLVLYFIAMLIFGPGSLLLGSHYNSSGVLILSAPLIALSYLTTGGAACVIPLVVFSYLDNKRALDVFHALPVTRGKMFLGNFIAGLVMLFAPYLLFGLPVMGALDANQTYRNQMYNSNMYDSNSYSAEYLTYALELIVLALFCYTLMTLLVLCCSTLLESAGYFGIIVVGYTVLVLLAFTIIQDMTFGCAGFSGIRRFFLGFSPVSMVMNGSLQPMSLIQQLLLSVIFFLLSYRRILQRRSEQVGGGYVWTPVYYIAAIGAAVTVGLATIEICNGDMIGLLIGLPLGMLTYIILDSLRNRGFGNLLRAILTGLGTAAVVAVVGLILHLTGTFGYEQWIPQTDEIASVAVDTGGSIDELRICSDFVLSDAENIERVRTLHQSVLSNQSIIENGGGSDDARLTGYDPYAFDTVDHEPYSMGSFYLELTYTLQDGRQVTRQYYHVPYELSKPLLELIQSQAYTDSIADTVEDSYNYLVSCTDAQLNEMIQNSSYELDLSLPQFGGSAYEEQLSLTPAMQNALMGALVEDLRARPAGSWLNPDSQPIGSLQYQLLRSNTNDEIDWINWESYTFNLYTTDTHLLALLQQYGYYDGETLFPNRSYTFYDLDMDAMVLTVDAYETLQRSGEINSFHFAGCGFGLTYTEVAYTNVISASEQADYLYTDGDAYVYVGNCALEGSFLDVTDRYRSEQAFTEEQLEQLLSLTLQVAYSEEPMDVLYLGGCTYLIPPENLAAVEAIIY